MPRAHAEFMFIQAGFVTFVSDQLNDILEGFTLLFAE